MEFADMTIARARELLDAKKISAVELTEHYLSEIEKKNSELNAYLEVFDDCLKQARAADKIISEGKQKQFTGIPLAVKDCILIKGKTASAASKILANYTATYDAFVIEKLKAQHAVFLGRTNMDEFAMGSSTENSAFGVTKNPHDLKRVPGGSSGGSAAAVAAGLALVALGSDTGGSVRQPAALCGVVGLKPTYGAVSRRGLIAMGSSLDQIGTFGKSTEDVRLLFEAICGHDSRDSTSLADDFFANMANGKPKTIGVPRNFLKEGIDADVLERFEKALTNLASAGYEVRDIDLPNVRHALPAYYIIMPAEASTNLARYDGLRYGVHKSGDDLLGDYMTSRGEGFGAETRRRILIGTFVLSSGYADAYYRKAEAVRELIRADFAKAFDPLAGGVDVIATPTSPTPAFKIGERVNDPLQMYAADIFTVPINMAGVPAMSVPMGTVERDGTQLPIGLQFIAPHGCEKTLFVIGSEARLS
jgi:aspartyl-tRNA(Asn)/glutamyl-tRNA(Gln) amidotransferase subunit A